MILTNDDAALTNVEVALTNVGRNFTERKEALSNGADLC